MERSTRDKIKTYRAYVRGSCIFDVIKSTAEDKSQRNYWNVINLDIFLHVSKGLQLLALTLIYNKSNEIIELWL